MTTDLAELFEALRENPLMGDAIPGTDGGRKIRMAISAKKKGKREGARVIAYVIEQTEKGDYHIWLLSIYDKSEYTDVKPEIIKEMIAEIIQQETDKEGKKEE